MATNDVPGANPANKDKLTRGCWGEHEDGSLIFVKDVDENDRVIFEVYDLKDPIHPIYYPHALSLKDFEDTFSFDRKKMNVPNLKWLWHDKTPFPWEKVMKVIDRPLPIAATVEDTVSAAARVAKSLKMRMSERVTEDHVLRAQGLESRPGTNAAKSIGGRIKAAIAALRAA